MAPRLKVSTELLLVSTVPLLQANMAALLRQDSTALLRPVSMGFRLKVSTELRQASTAHLHQANMVLHRRDSTVSSHLSQVAIPVSSNMARPLMDGTKHTKVWGFESQGRDWLVIDPGIS